MIWVYECSNEDPGPFPGPRCLSALAESNSSGTSIMCFVLLLDDIRVDVCSNEDPGPLSGPRWAECRECKAVCTTKPTSTKTAFLVRGECWIFIHFILTCSPYDKLGRVDIWISQDLPMPAPLHIIPSHPFYFFAFGKKVVKVKNYYVPLTTLIRFTTAIVASIWV